MKKLELKHLACYLPYGLKIKNGITTYTMVCDAKQYDADGFLSLEFVEGIASKPILRPLSDLTKEIKVDGEKFYPFEKIINAPLDYEKAYRVLGKRRFEILFDNDGEAYLEKLSTDPKGWPYYYLTYLFKWHFDVFDLIDAGLAIDINTLEDEKAKS